LGFVEKEVSVKDGRVRVVQLTKEGESKFASFKPEHDRVLGDIFGRLSSEQKRETIQQLNQLRKLMDEPKETPS